MALLTDTKARNLKPDDKAIAHGGVTGLALHPSTAKGRGNWVLRYVSPVTGKRRNVNRPHFPRHLKSLKLRSFRRCYEQA
ncbi:hypothetical protein ACK32Z_18285, partial [Aeromonas hydrophila]